MKFKLKKSLIAIAPQIWVKIVYIVNSQFKIWFCTQKPVWTDHFKDFLNTKINRSQKYILISDQYYLKDSYSKNKLNHRFRLKLNDKKYLSHL